MYSWNNNKTPGDESFSNDFDAKPSTSGYALGSITPSANSSADSSASFDFPADHHGKKRAANSLNNENDPELNWAIYAAQNFPMFAPYSPARAEFSAGNTTASSPAFGQNPEFPNMEPKSLFVPPIEIPQQFNYAAAAAAAVASISTNTFSPYSGYSSMDIESSTAESYPGFPEQQQEQQQPSAASNTKNTMLTRSSTQPRSTHSTAAAAPRAPASVTMTRRLSEPSVSTVSMRSCAHCALTGCLKCVEGSRKAVPQSCHVPEHGRSVCAACAAAHRTILIPRERALFVPHELHADLESAVSRVQPSSSLVAAHPFTLFYAHLNCSSRCFEVFDAFDSQLWQTPLSFSRVYVFTSVEAADNAKAAFPDYLFSLPDETSDGADAMEIDETKHLVFRVCAQCSAYQIQFPSTRMPRDSDTAISAVGSSRRSGVAAIPNFYSNSLCRKANASHLKKHAQKGKDPVPEPLLTVPAPAQPPRRLRAVASDGAISSALAMSTGASNNVNLKQTQDTLEMATQMAQTAAAIVERAKQSRLIGQNDSPANATQPAPLPGQNSPNLHLHVNPANLPIAQSLTHIHNSSLLPVPRPETASKSNSPVNSVEAARFSSVPTQSSSRSAFRSRIAFQMLSQHRFAAFREYLKSFPINRETEPVLFTRIETLRLVSRFFEIVDVAQMVSPMNEHTDAYQSKQHLTSTTDAALSGASALASMLLSEDTNKLILREEQLERILGSLRDNINALITFSVDSRSLFALQNPAVFISSKLFRFVFDAVFTNGAFLGGYPDTLLRGNKALAGTRFSLADILQSAASFLDELVVLKALEHNGSDLHRLIVHTEVSVLWILGAIMSRATEAKMFLKHQRRSLQAFIELSNMKVEEDKSPLGADQHIVVLSARQMQQHFDFPDLPPIVNEPDSTDLYQRAITIALNHTGRMFDLGKTGNGDLALHITNLPRDTVLAAAMPAFISRAFNEISSGLVAEAADPRHAFCYEQLLHNQAVFGSSVYEGDGIDDFASPQISPQDMLSLMSWNVCFDHAYESSPAFLLMPIFTIVTSAYFVAPVCKENDEEALFRRRAEVDRAWSQLSVTTRQSWSSSTNTQPADNKNAFKAPRRALRSTRGIQLMQLALGLAQKLEDSCVTAACVLHLSMMLIYWCPHYALAMRMLERLDSECGDLLKHLPASVGPAFERNFIISCRAQALSIIRQFRQHSMASLRTPFYVGTLISIPFADGVLDGILVPASVSHLMCVLCQHPKYGILYTFVLSLKELDHMCKDIARSWRNLFYDIKHDSSATNHFFGVYPTWSLFHEIRMGRYSISRFVADLKARETIIVQ